MQSKPARSFLFGSMWSWGFCVDVALDAELFFFLDESSGLTKGVSSRADIEGWKVKSFALETLQELTTDYRELGKDGAET